MRRMPGGLSLQQGEGVQEPLARVLQGGRVRTLPGDRGGSDDKDRGGVRGSLWGDSSHAPWALGEIGGAKESLMEASKTEKNPWCLQEIRLALVGGTKNATLG